MLRGTRGHPIWSMGRGCWVAMGELEVGEALSGTAGPVTVVARQLELGRFLVYNLLVQDAHSYRVGARGVLVHNGCPVETRTLGDFTEKRWTVPGDRGGASRAEYHVWKNAEGRVIKTYKDSFDQHNRWEHRKPLRGGPEGRPADG
ncbi:MAG: polymorphic toxin-type HINT domain-containing protein [Planctomycetota bacterium]